ncbi:4Fe-4S binding protein [candidate division KSB1 bacterium]|nr:4Fe-4S binding protein [candidate division KSB1 bacterium]
MGHMHSKSGMWEELRSRLDQHPTGLPRHASLERILSILFTAEEAELATGFPPTTISLPELASQTGRAESDLLPLLDSMAAKGLVMEIERDGITHYFLSAAFPGFFEYTFMRVNKDLPYQELGRLMEEYFQQSDLAKEMAGLKTQRMRTLLRRDALADDLVSEVLPYETARGLIEQVEYGSLQTCFCRHKGRHLGQDCALGAPVDDICMSFGVTADFLIKRGFARRAEKNELLQVLDHADALGLVHIADNFRDNVIFMCHCCGCCCELLKIITQKRLYGAVAPTRFMAMVDEQLCNGCGVCEERCQIQAIHTGDDGIARVNESCCIGCGVCIHFCPSEALRLQMRQETVVPPLNLRAMTMRILKEKRKIG